jgi:hypothetical protein
VSAIVGAALSAQRGEHATALCDFEQVWTNSPEP